MQTHLFPQTVPSGGSGKRHQTKIYWAINPWQHVAIVFVHGFKGDNTSTWLRFQTFLQKDVQFSGCDLIFYGYDGERTRSSVSAGLLRKFLDRFFSAAPSISNQHLSDLSDTYRRPNDFTYRDIVIVAHSLGAVVTREALLDAHRLGSGWVKHTRLVLFAPAHMGADIINLVRESVSGFPIPVIKKGLQLVYLSLRWRWKVLRDLERGSTTLKELHSRTEQALNRGRAQHLIAKCVVHGEYDSVVEPIVFLSDPPSEISVGKSHTEVCKPTDVFGEPILVIKRAWP